MEYYKLYYEKDYEIEFISEFKNINDAYAEVKNFWDKLGYHICRARQWEITQKEKDKIFNKTTNIIYQLDIGFHSRFYYIEYIEREECIGNE